MNISSLKKRFFFSSGIFSVKIKEHILVAWVLYFCAISDRQRFFSLLVVISLVVFPLSLLTCFTFIPEGDNKIRRSNYFPYATN